MEIRLMKLIVGKLFLYIACFQFVECFLHGERCVDNGVDRHWTCGDRLICNANNFCECSSEYDTVYIYDFRGRVECHVKKDCVSKKTLQLPLWCEDGEFNGYCNKTLDQCICDGYVSISKEKHETYNELTDNSIGEYGRCVDLNRKLGGFCMRFTPCDAGLGLKCIENKCLCKDGFVYNFDREVCESKKEYLEKYNLTEYKVRQGHYCTEDEHCLYGLECSEDQSCQCSWPCNVYDKERDACDCGGEYPGAIGPIIVGILAGLGSVVIWSSAIFYAYKNGKLKLELLENEVRYSQYTPDNRAANTGNDISLISSNAQTTQQPSAPPLDRLINNDRPPSYEDVMSANDDKSEYVREQQYQTLPPKVDFRRPSLKDKA